MCQGGPGKQEAATKCNDSTICGTRPSFVSFCITCFFLYFICILTGVPGTASVWASLQLLVGPVRYFGELGETARGRLAIIRLASVASFVKWKQNLRDAGLHKDLVDVADPPVECRVQGWELFKADSVSDHEARVKGAVLQILHNFAPVLVDRCLTVSDESDPLLHQGAYIEVVRES